MRVGEKETSEQAAIVARFADLFTREQLAVLRAAEDESDDAGRESLESDLIALVDQYDRLCGGAVAIPATYTEAVARKR